MKDFNKVIHIYIHMSGVLVMMMRRMKSLVWRNMKRMRVLFWTLLKEI